MATMAQDSLKSIQNQTHILVVDPNIGMLQFHAQRLKSYAYQVTIAKSKRDFRSLINDKSKKFDLVFLEARFPEPKDGFLLLENTLREEIPTFVMSFDDEGSIVAREAIEKGACFYIQKPISFGFIKNLWVYALKSKMDKETKATEKTKGKRVEIISEQKNENSNATSSRKRPMNEVNNVITIEEWERKRKGKAPCMGMSEDIGETFAVDAYRPQKYNPVNNVEMMNYEPNFAPTLVAGPFQNINDGFAADQNARKYGAMPYIDTPVYMPQPLPFLENDAAQGIHQAPPFENNSISDEHFNAFLENIAPSSHYFDTNNMLQPLFNYQLPRAEDTESFPFRVDDLLLDKSSEGNGL